MKLLLDTCTLIWLTSDPNSLSEKAVQVLGNPSHQLYFSDSSIWEICLKWTSGKLKLPQPPRQWVQEQAERWFVELIPIERSHLFRVSELPLYHRDPYDRLLVAAAIERRMTLLTPDPEIHRYPVAWLW